MAMAVLSPPGTPFSPERKEAKAMRVGARSVLPEDPSPHRMGQHQRAPNPAKTQI